MADFARAAKGPLPDASDDDLVQLLCDGNPCHGTRADALTELEHRYGQRVLLFVQGMLRDTHAAQDVTQDVFEKLLRKADLYRQGTNFRAWLFEIARNQALSALRIRRRTPRAVSALGHAESRDGDVGLLDQADTTRVDSDYEEQELMDALGRAVAGLPERYRQVFEICVQNGRPYQDAANQLGLPVGTVAIRIMRARRRLYQELAHHLGRLRRPPACFQ
jgi:RNA polymerase sigma-70 factor (ECF subfamily)